MFGLFKKKSELEKLQEQYEKLMKRWYQVSAINRSESDTLYAEAEAILNKMEALRT
ncbi:MAG: Lacal_2735 family protein [Flavobacteriaceae bacterium]|nr:Lacal_2735 family protein [Flavobacteriaceae bacterium]